MKRTLSISIVAFFCVMNFLLLKRNLRAPPAPIPLRTVSAVTETMDEWWGIYYRGERIGHAAQKITPGPAGYSVEAFSELRLNLLGTVQTLKTKLAVGTAADWALEAFDFSLDSDGVPFGAKGTIADDRLRLTLDSGGHRTTKDLPLKRRPFLFSTLKPYIVTQQIEPGKEQFFPIFDPSTLSLQTASLTIEGREHIDVGGKSEPAIRVRQRFKGLSVVSWIDGTGRTLKEESPGGFTLIREKAGAAALASNTRSVPLDLIVQTSVPLDRPITDPMQKSSLKLRLSGFDAAQFSLEGGRQRFNAQVLEIEREDLGRIRSYSLPSRNPRLAAYLQSSPFLQSDHPEIQATARRAVQGETDAAKAVTRLIRWVYNGLAKEPTVSIPNALAVLQTKKGDCNEHTVLFNALARAAGIPAKTVVGVVYLRGAFYYHAWSEVWLGEWISVDSVLNQFPADVTHVKFLEGEIDRQVDILGLIGKLKIELVEAS